MKHEGENNGGAAPTIAPMERGSCSSRAMLLVATPEVLSFPGSAQFPRRSCDHRTGCHRLQCSLFPA